MFSKFSEKAQKVLLVAKDEMIKLKHPYVGSEHLILAILSDESLAITKKLNKFNLNYDNFKNQLIKIIGIGKNSNNWFLYTPLLKRIIENSIFDSKEQNEKYVTVERLFLSLLEEGDGVGIRILISMNISIEDIYNSFNYKFNTKKNKKDKKLIVDEYSVNFNKKALADEIDPVVCRDKEVDRIIEILSRRCKNNPLLVGEAGVGKTAIVEELARRIVNKEVPKFLQNKTILSISISAMVAGTKYRGEFEERINKILKEVESDGNIILFIDEIHTIVGAGGAEGAIDASNILKPSLARGKIKIIGATTNAEYHSSIEKDKALDRRFQKVNILEPDNKSTKKILVSLRDIYSSYHHVKVSDDILNYIIKLTDNYMTNQNNPDKSIDVLDEVCAKASLITSSTGKKIKEYSKQLVELKKEKNIAVIDGDFEKANECRKQEHKIETRLNKYNLTNNVEEDIVITKRMVEEVVEQKTKIPIYEINSISQFNTQSIEKQLLKKIIGQEEIVKDLCKYTKLIKSGFSKNRPYSFLLMGQTGVGKTMLVKEYAKLLYGRESFIRIDMSEYKEEHTISKIIGSPPGYVGYQDDNYVLEKVRNNPYSIILLDEIEKANPSVLKLFLQVLDEGFMHDASSRKIDFRHTIIFMTSNLGKNDINIGFSENKNSVEMKNFFSIEFLNRIDKIYEFNKLNRDNVKKIVSSKLKNLKEKYREKNIEIILSKDIVNKIIDKSNFEEYGARKIDKIIEDVITIYILDMITSGNNKINLKELREV